MSIPKSSSAPPSAAAESGEAAGIAIIGMAGRFPGARNVDQLWQNLKAGKEGIHFFSDEELAETDYEFGAVKDDPSYVKARGVLDDVEMFDARFFGFSPREAATLDPQQRIWFEIAWEALEEAGYDSRKYDGSIGVFAGCGYLPTYLLHNLCADRKYIEELVRMRAVDAFTAIVGNDKDFLPTRTSYLMNLSGPSINVQTACSTSLVAVAQACQSLLNYDSDVCIAGGISIQLPQERGYFAQEGGMDSTDGHCYVFDERAKGTVFSHGAGAVILKRVDDAIADGDNILAVIRGYATNNDGFQKASYVAPSVDGQAEVIALAQAMAGFPAETITYLEAHGTATPTGDPIEIAGLNKAFRVQTDAKQFCGIGSIKSNIGHLDAACGVAGLIKTVLAVQHGQLPPTINYEQPNPKIDFENSPFHVVNKLTDWQPSGFPRRAGVSSFGVGGTNVHVVLEEPPTQPSTSPSRPHQLLMLSATTESALESATENLAAHLSTSQSPLGDVAFTTQVGRKDMAHRRFAIVSDTPSAIEALRSGDKKRLKTAKTTKPAESIVFMFPGQGTQHVNMGRALYESEPIFRNRVDHCAEILESILGMDIRTIIYPTDDETEAAAEKLKQTAITQPALFVVEYALAQQWMAWGIYPDAMIGHSVGEYVAACLAGVFSLEDVLTILAHRAQLMQNQPPGDMLAVRLPESELVPYLSGASASSQAIQVSVAAYNSPSLSVLSGPSEAIEAIAQRLEADSVKTRALHTSHAFHSAMMEPTLEPFMAKFNEVTLGAPSIPFISSFTGTWIRAEEAVDPRYWANQVRHAVRFSDGIIELHNEPNRLLLEVGPNTSLSTLARQHKWNDHNPIVVSTLGHPQESRSDVAVALEAVGRLWQAGVSIDWLGFYQHETRRRVVLPTYPFERKRHWVDPVKPSAEVGQLSANQLPGEPPVANQYWANNSMVGYQVDPSFSQMAQPYVNPYVTHSYDPNQAYLNQYARNHYYPTTIGHVDPNQAYSNQATVDSPMPGHEVANAAPQFGQPELNPNHGTPPAPITTEPISASIQAEVVTSAETNLVETDQTETKQEVFNMSSTGGRAPRIISRLKEIMHDLSGIEPEDLEIDVTFLEMGMDSLFLSQVSTALQNEFDTPIRFRQLIEEVDTLELLAGYFDERIDPALFAAPEAAEAETTATTQPEQPTQTTMPAQPQQMPPQQMPPQQIPPQQMPAQGQMMPGQMMPGQMPAPQMPMMQPSMPQMPMMQPGMAMNPYAMQQMAAMQYAQMQYMQQMAMMTGQMMPMIQPGVMPGQMMPGQMMPQQQIPIQPTPAAPAAPQSAPVEPKPEPAKEASVKAGKEDAVAKKDDDTPEDEKKQFGAMARIKRRATENQALTEAQNAAIERIIAAYEAKMPGSKQFTAESRSYMSDPRAVSGFNPQFKEMIFPPVVKKSKGSKLWDLDDNEFVDFINGYGSNFFGNQPDFLLDAIKAQMDLGYEIGPQHPLTAEVARLVVELTGVERVAFCNTGSEAVLGSWRQARTVTGRRKVAIFGGSYHGINGEVIVRTGGTLGMEAVGGPRKNQAKNLKAFPAAPGIMPNEVENVVVLDYGSPDSLDILREIGGELAAICVEPVQSRRPELQPKEFLHELREIATEHGCALIFDEIITGFRLAQGGAQEYFGVKADIVTYGKVVGGGLPFAVVAGNRRFMDALDGGQWEFGDDSIPEVGVTYFAGTFVRHPLALAASKAALEYMKAEGPQLQQRLIEKMTYLCNQLVAHFERVKAPITIARCASLINIRISPELPQPQAGLLYYLLRHRGVHIYEGYPCFLTTAHSDEDIEFILQMFKESIHELQVVGLMPGIPDPSLDSTLTVMKKDSKAIDPQELASNGAYANGNGTNGNGKKDSNGHHANGTDIATVTGGSEVAANQIRFRLGEAQKDLFFAANMSEMASCAYNELFTLEISGPLHVETFIQAINIAKSRHEALNVKMSPLGDFQTLDFAQKMEIHIVDLATESTGAQMDHIEAVIEEWATRPFDLFKGPLVKGKLFALAGDKYIYLSAAHHVVFDGWSSGVYVEEIGAIYETLRAGTPLELAAAPSYWQYIEDESTFLESAEGASQLKYWLDIYATQPEPLNLPTDHQRPADRTYKGNSVHWSMRPEVYQAVKEAARKNKVTLYTFMLASFNLLVHRLTNQNDFVVGIPYAGQSVVDEFDLVGHCVNNLGLRTTLNEGATFSDLLSQTKTTLLNGQENGRVTIGTVLRNGHFERDLSRAPLIEVVFNLNRQMPGEGIAGLQVQLHEVAKRAVAWDLFLNLDETDTNIIASCDYNTDVYTADTIRRWLNSYEALLAAVVNDPNSMLEEYALLSASDYTEIVDGWNRTQVAYPSDPVQDLITIQASQTPDKVAVRAGDVTISYAELEKWSNQLARHLGTMGISNGSLVGICTNRSTQMMVGLLGILKAGAAYVPLDPDYPDHRVNYMIEDAGLSVIVTESEFKPDLPASVTSVLLDEDWRRIADQSVTKPDVVVKPDEAAYVIYTSGSTGNPKGVQVTHRGLTNFLSSMQKEPGISSSDVIAAVTTISFDIAALELYLPLISGAQTLIVPRETAVDGYRLAEVLRDSSVTIMQATPATWQMLLESGWTNDTGIKMLCGGEALSTALARALTASGAELWNMYGPTETTIWSAVQEIDPAESKISIGRPIANTQTYILDSSLRPVPVGTVGELYIGGDGLAQGYLNRPELTDERFVPNPFRQAGARMYKTGDLARFLPDGRIECLGRNDSQVKVRGFRIELGEIEAALAEQEMVQQAVVVLREDTLGDKRLAGYMTLADGHQFDVHALRIQLQDRLPEYMVPPDMVVLDSFPLTPNGKVDRKALPVPNRERVDSAETYVAPESPIQKEVATIWSQVLEIKEISIHDSFFQLGGHSLQATRILARLREMYDVDFSLRLFFGSPTIEGIATNIAQMLFDAEENDDEILSMIEEVQNLSPEELASLLDS